MGRGELLWESDDICVALVNGDDYTPNFVADKVLADIPEEAIIAISEPLDNTEILDTGWAQADDATFPEVEGEPGEAVVVFKRTADDETSTLIAYLDSELYQSVIPNGSDILVVWPSSGVIRF
ncbi:hypothetical protein SEA_HARRYOW_34 [Mycobacterium phage HarryOW]|uniref:Uncharacterized protein n=2 Tax=Viruses TaxID=10239 RepID=G1D384_9CAUD|nr:hypothetical protein FGG24_gp35 [Mycobacterium phage JC27]AEK09234.1 hypothetical protein PBI_JC27_35 [Mycobacterium phage JC27]ASZ74008.1 hypothetical protein SEA_SMAIRT_34 [Mycobacterium phage Smairt]QNJ59677.1 hypothetical protein SEA_HARRYOW_34 [Mycobacterium phage HarryOW]